MIKKNASATSPFYGGFLAVLAVACSSSSRLHRPFDAALLALMLLLVPCAICVMQHPVRARNSSWRQRGLVQGSQVPHASQGATGATGHSGVRWSRLAIIGPFFAYEPLLFFEHAPLVRFPCHQSPNTFVFVIIPCTLVRSTSHKSPQPFFFYHCFMYNYILGGFPVSSTFRGLRQVKRSTISWADMMQLASAESVAFMGGTVLHG